MPDTQAAIRRAIGSAYFGDKPTSHAVDVARLNPGYAIEYALDRAESYREAGDNTASRWEAIANAIRKAHVA